MENMLCTSILEHSHANYPFSRNNDQNHKMKWPSIKANFAALLRHIQIYYIMLDVVSQSFILYLFPIYSLHTRRAFFHPPLRALPNNKIIIIIYQSLGPLVRTDTQTILTTTIYIYGVNTPIWCIGGKTASLQEPQITTQVVGWSVGWMVKRSAQLNWAWSDRESAGLNTARHMDARTVRVLCIILHN